MGDRDRKYRDNFYLCFSRKKNLTRGKIEKKWPWKKKSPWKKSKKLLKITGEKQNLPVFQINTILYPQMIALLSNSNFWPWNKRFLTQKKNWKMCPWKISVRENEKHGKKRTCNHFFSREETSKRSQNWVSQAVLVFKGKETLRLRVSKPLW